MKINELQARQGNVEVEGVIAEVSEPREFEKFGKKGRVANAQLKDESGQVKLSLWNEQIDQVKIGDRVKVSKGYVSEWQGELQLTTGKFGTLEVLGEGSATDADEIKEAMASEPAPEPAAPVPAEEPKKEAPAEQSDLDVEEEEVM